MSLYAKQIECVDLRVGYTSIVILLSNDNEITPSSVVLTPVTDYVNGYVFSAALYAGGPAEYNRAFVELTREPDAVSVRKVADALAYPWNALLTVTIQTGTTEYPIQVPVDYPS